MKNDFDSLINRRNTSSMKWDADGYDSDVMPLWVADMDFRTAPCIINALRKRVEHGIFGYVDVPSSYFDALTHWFETRHKWHIDRSKVIYTSGVVPAISAIIKGLAKAGEGVILQTPAYNCFFSSIRNNGCKIIDNPLKRVETETGFTYRVDYDNLETLASDPLNRLMILCNPHNPSGRVWTRNELERIKEICDKNGVRVISDEIHCELVHPNSDPYTPYALVDPQAIICCSPSKAFNIAGLQIANIVAPDNETRAKIDRAINDNEVCDVNPFGVQALQAAYNEGEEWLTELNSYLFENYRHLREFFREQLPQFPVCDSQSTYLAWIDITATGIESDEIEKILLKKAKVRISSGTTYGDSSYIRINYACPRSRLDEALNRIAAALNNNEN